MVENLKMLQRPNAAEETTKRCTDNVKTMQKNLHLFVVFDHTLQMQCKDKCSAQSRPRVLAYNFKII